MDGRGVDRTPYEAALRLYLIAGSRWAEIEATYYMTNLLDETPRKFLNLIYAWCVERITPDEREKWETMLVAPLPGAKPKKPSERTAEDEGAAFMAMMQTHKALTTGEADAPPG